MSKLRILCSHEASGALRSRFRAAGHDAWSCDLRDAADGSPHHIKADVFDVVGLPWDAAIFHFDCTYHTISAAWAFKDPDFIKYPGVGYHQRVKPSTLTGAARRAKRVADEANVRRLDEASAHIPIRIFENPHGTIWKAWKPYTQVVQPFEHGDDASKATCLRIEGLPPIPVDPARYVKPRLVCSDCRGVFPWGLEDCPYCRSERYLPRWANQTDGGQNRLSPGDDRWSLRSDTYPGIADSIVAHVTGHLGV